MMGNKKLPRRAQEKDLKTMIRRREFRFLVSKSALYCLRPLAFRRFLYSFHQILDELADMALQ